MGDKLVRMPCPACGQRIKFGVEDEGTEAYCPHCDTPVVLHQEAPPPPKPGRGVPKAMMIGVPVAAFAVVFGLIVTVAVVKRGKSAPKVAQGEQVEKTESKAAPAKGGAKAPKKVARLNGYKRPFQPAKEEKIVFDNPTPRAPGSPTQLMGHKVIDAQSGKMQYVVGLVKNHTKTRFFDVEIIFDLLDEKGKKIGEAKDYVGSLSGNETWEFKATIYSRGAKSAKLRKIDQDPE
jgi:endogenous inhibitor of DNA gyrase (YacG/DUF329 family)